MKRQELGARFLALTVDYFGRFYLSGVREKSAFGGEGGIRTHGTVAGTPHFECGAFDLSATSPQEDLECWPAGAGSVAGGL
jgi:hypothetical protein